ncbi:flagellar hook-length control protein FliK, partial [Aeromonas salmonicida]
TAPGELQHKVNVMLADKLQQAELQLDPVGLGKMKIHLQMGQDQQVSVHFVVQHGQTREMLEQSMPRLREMLAGQGIQLGQTQVQYSQQGQQQGQQMGQSMNQGGRGHSSDGYTGGGDEETQVTSGGTRLIRESATESGIDFYA